MYLYYVWLSPSPFSLLLFKHVIPLHLILQTGLRISWAAASSCLQNPFYGPEEWDWCVYEHLQCLVVGNHVTRSTTSTNWAGGKWWVFNRCMYIDVICACVWGICGEGTWRTLTYISPGAHINLCSHRSDVAAAADLSTDQCHWRVTVPSPESKYVCSLQLLLTISMYGSHLTYCLTTTHYFTTILYMSSACICTCACVHAHVCICL